MSAEKSQTAEFCERRLHTREETTTTSSSNSNSRTSYGHESQQQQQQANSKLEQLDVLAAELIDSAKAIGQPVTQSPAEQSPAVLKLALHEGELISSGASIDYAASYYIEHSESWGEVDYGAAPAQRTNETTVVRATEKKRNDSFEVQDVTDLELDAHLLQSGQSYVVEYESKGGPDEEPKYAQPRRRIDRRSDTVDIRKVAEERPTEELGYTLEEFTSSSSTMTTTTTTQHEHEHDHEQQQQQQQRRRHEQQSLVAERRDASLERVGRDRTTYTTSTTWDGTFVPEQSAQQMTTTTVVYERPDETDEPQSTKVTATEIEVRVEATRPTPTPRKINSSTWDGSFVLENARETNHLNESHVLENSRETSHRSEILVLEEAHFGDERLRESYSSARDSDEHQNYFTTETVSRSSASLASRIRTSNASSYACLFASFFLSFILGCYTMQYLMNVF
jgi:hypothetical protein